VERAGRGAFILFVSGVLAAGLLVMLVINTSLAQGAFAVTELQKQIDILSEQEQALTREIANASGPVALETAARSLGMVPNANPVFIDVEAGEILGKPKATRGTRAQGRDSVSVGADLPVKAKRQTMNGWSPAVIVDDSTAVLPTPKRPAPMEAVLVN
jgi:cell division protein FtsB